MEKVWILKETPAADLVEALAQALGIDPTLAALLVQRGVTNFEEAKTFFRPDWHDLHDPFLMQDMDKAVERLQQALEQQEKILIYGDYDVDGCTAVALVYGFLQTYHQPLLRYQPDRIQEGYGVTQQGVEWAQNQGVSLMICLDCGITAHHSIALAKQAGIDTIVCDHHLPEGTLPEAIALLDPKRSDCAYPFKELTGCGVGFKLLQAFCIRQSIDLDKLLVYSDLLAISIAADIVPIVGENRLLTLKGLEYLKKNTRPGIQQLLQHIRLDPEKNLTVSDLVFKIAPRLNAAGRVMHARRAADLLLAQNQAEAAEAAEVVEHLNEQRKAIDQQMTQEAMALIEKLHPVLCASTVLFKPNWHIGVVGIVAARCMEYAYRPTIILTQHRKGDLIIGSARSTADFDLHQALRQCADLLEKFGGHQHAAGLALRPENLIPFVLRFEALAAAAEPLHQVPLPRLVIDAPLRLTQIDAKFVRVLKQFAPFGPGQHKPIFWAKNLVAEEVKILKSKFLKCLVREMDGSTTFEAIGFEDFSQFFETLQAQTPFELCFCVEENYFQQEIRLQLVIKAIRIAEKTTIV